MIDRNIFDLRKSKEFLVLPKIFCPEENKGYLIFEHKPETRTYTLTEIQNRLKSIKLLLSELNN